MKKFACFLAGLICFLFSYSKNNEFRPDTPPPSDSIGYTGSDHICQGSSLLLTANYAPAGATFQWVRNGSDIAGATSSTYQATLSGTYTVKVTDNGNTTTWPSVTVTVHAYPVASFTANPLNQCANEPVQFTNTSTGASSYTWDFGNPASGASNTSTAANPQHVFVTTAGNGTQNFTVKLVADIAGCKDSATTTVTIKQLPGTELGGTGYTTYNGLPYFTQCASVTSPFTFTNQSSTAATNAEYIIKWGDNSPDFTATSWSSTTHTYNIGTWPLQYIVTGANGCKDTTTYYVFVGNNPAVGLNNPGNTFICSNTELTFPISGTGNNPPGTVYTVLFNDGSNPETFTHPAPPDITHMFDVGSCGVNSGTFVNSFQASIQASNPCGTSAASVVPIYVSERGSALFSIYPYDTVCTTNTVTFTNVSQNAYGVSASGVCSPGKGIWSITPATGWSISSGALGNDFGSTDPSLWMNGSTSLNINFTTPGTYSIKLRIGASTLCSGDSIVRTICVNPAPQAAFDLSSNSGCAPLTVTTTNNSNTPLCGDNIYQWSVNYSNPAGCAPGISDYTYLNGTSASSANPEFQFNTPGEYTITLVTRSPNGTCTSTPVTQTVTVKDKATVSINAPNAICQNGTIDPTPTVNNCSATAATYLWSFPGGNPSSSTDQIPGTIVYNTPGTHTITLSVTNDCGTTTVTKNITVNPAPDAVVPSPTSFCAGEATGGFNFTSSVPGTTFSWTNSNTAIGLAASGTGNIPDFTVTNPGASPITATITVTPFSGCAGPSQSFNITVNPTPAAPTVTSPVQYCLNETASALSATPSGSNGLTWYTSLTGTGSATAPTPSTSTAGSTTYYVTQTNSFGCESPAASIVVNVLPQLTGNTIGSDQTICTGTAVNPFTGTATLSGGNGTFAYQWQQSTDGGATWTNIAGATSASYAPGTVTSNTKYRRIVTSVSCSDTSNTVDLIVQGSLTDLDVAAPQTICAGTAPSLLTGQTPSGGTGTFVFQWESSTDNVNWSNISGATGTDYQPSTLTTTTHYRRKTTSGPCAAYSSPVTITVLPKPVLTQQPDLVVCTGMNPVAIQLSSTPMNGNVSFEWTNSETGIGIGAAGSTNLIPSTFANNTNPKVPLAGDFAAVATYTDNGVSCPGDTMYFSITTLPVINLAPINDTVVCTGTPLSSFVPVHDAGNAAGSSVTYNWTVSGSGTNLASGSGSSIPAIITQNAGTTDLVTTVTVTPVYHYSNTSCNGTPEVYTITVKPGTPSADAGPDIALCDVTSYTMQAIQPAGTTGNWVQIGGPAANIVIPSSSTTDITGLVPGNIYQFEWNVSGFATCPPSKDTVVIRVDEAIINTISTSTATICAGQQAIITGATPTGGNGSYQYSWEQSTDNVNWTTISGQTGVSLSFVPTSTVYVRRLVTSLPCEAYSNVVQIVVQPALSNNIISADQSVCVNTAASMITGALPTGGNGSYQYQWQQSTDGGATWNDIAGATSQDYTPGVMTVTTMFRRLVSTSLCSGPQASTSNVVTVTVNPDAIASFNPTTVDGCVPFVLTPSVINLQTYPANNGQYVWYADDVFIGNGSVFPGYTMTQADDTVVIKLVAVSAFGCLSDSISHEFHTYKVPQPSFTLSDTVGCGPLDVLITNTTPEINAFSYYWDFGNGLTSTQEQPGNITFLPNPTFGDTVYTVTLHAITLCDTISTSQTIRVKSKPKALFTPNSSVGCSPMTVVFNNTSAGIGNTYTWDFGDGSATVTTNSAGTISHTFHTGVQDTFYVKLVANNECGSDSMTYAIVVSPNAVQLDFAINGNQFSGCAPHTVQFINNSSGASSFIWNFGDGNIISTIKNIDTVTHTYLIPGNYTVTLFATNGCSDTTSTESIVIYPKPQAAFTASAYTACIGENISFANGSSGATSYLWQFGDGNTSTLTDPQHAYTTPGIYNVKLITYSLNVSGTVCVDSVEQQIQITASQPGSFSVSDSVGHCTPFTVTFTNNNVPSTSATWDFGDNTTGSGDVVSHTYTQPGNYIVTLTVVAPGGCTYVSVRTIQVLGPSGTWTHSTGYLCDNNAANFTVQASNWDSLQIDFGDGNVLTTTSNIVFHNYVNPGVYFPSLIIKNSAGCAVSVDGIDSIRVDRIDGGFTATQQTYCGHTEVVFTDTSHVFFGKDSVVWNFGDGTQATGFQLAHNYSTSGTYPIQQIIYGKSGCTDTITRQVTVHVNSQPVVSISAPATACTNEPIQFVANIQSTDPIGVVQWTMSNGVTETAQQFNYAFAQAGTYDVQLVAGTTNGCYDTIATTIVVNPSPTVTASTDITLCLGASAPLNASGAGITQWNWSPLSGLSCYNCNNPIASPTITTPYVVEGINAFGCADTDTVVVTVIQPLNLTLASADSICIGESTNLLASGATTYSWSPAAGLNNTTISNPTASPTVTTTYRVVGYDGFNCFTDTAYVTVAVGQYPVVSLGPDLTLATGTLQPLNTVIQNGPIVAWEWSPSANLSCDDCPLPVAEIKNDITYTVQVTTAYGCSATDTIRIKTFCQNAQVFIPNAFTPDGDGHNDVLMVRATGVSIVRSFRIFNRWGEVVFERGNFAPNLPQYGWDGRIKGVASGPDVFVYTAEVVCDNGTVYTYKGNVTILK